jgi:hypothetical protein
MLFFIQNFFYTWNYDRLFPSVKNIMNNEKYSVRHVKHAARGPHVVCGPYDNTNVNHMALGVPSVWHALFTGFCSIMIGLNSDQVCCSCWLCRPFGKSLCTYKRCWKWCPRPSIRAWTLLILFPNTFCRSACEMFLMYAVIAVFNSLTVRGRSQTHRRFCCSTQMKDWWS